MPPLWVAEGAAFISATLGGELGTGQVFRLDLDTDTLEVLAASTDPAVLDMPDNLQGAQLVRHGLAIVWSGDFEIDAGGGRSVLQDFYRCDVALAPGDHTGELMENAETRGGVHKETKVVRCHG